MKKIIILLLSLLMLVFPTACGNGENDNSSKNSLTDNVTVPEIITDKTEYNFGDSISVNVNIPAGNTTECTLIAVPEYLKLDDNGRMTSDSAYTQGKITQSTSLEFAFDNDKWFPCSYDLRLIANEQVVAKTTFSLIDNSSIYGMPEDVTLDNEHVPTEPENIYISKIKLSIPKSGKIASVDTALPDAYEVRVRLNGGDWSEIFKVNKKSSKAEKDKVDTITIFSLDKYKNGLEDNDNTVYNIFKDIIDVMHTNPADYPNGRLYIDTTKHIIELQIRYSVDDVRYGGDNTCHWSMPLVIGAY